MAVDNQTALNYSLLVTALLLWYLLYLFFGYLLDLGIVRSFLGPHIGETARRLLPFLLGLAGAGAAFFLARKNEAVNRFGVEVVVELKKVIWPTRKEITGSTGAVLIVVFLVALVLFIFDKLFGWFITILVR